MRLKYGRPDLSTYADRFDVPEADGELSVTFLGVSSLLFDDGESALMIDGYFSRPSLLKALLRPISPDVPRIDAALRRVGFGSGGRRLEAVAPVHTHFDHVLDSAVVAKHTGGVLVGGESTANVGRGGGLEEERIVVVTPGEPRTFGAFTITHLESSHCPPDRFPGNITAPVVPPVKMSDYKCGEAWAILVEHTSGRTALVQGSAGYREDAFAGHAADVAYVGVGQLGVMGECYIKDYWAHTVEAVGARRVVLTHWDDFFRSLDESLRALPYAGDDLHVTMRILTALAAEQGVFLHLPTLWRREDPWANL